MSWTLQVQQAVVLTSAMAGKNAGKSGASIGDSASVGLNYLGDGNKEIRVANLSKPIDLWIKRSAKLKMQDYTFINADHLPDKSRLITYKYELFGTDVSSHIQIKPYLKWTEDGENRGGNNTGNATTVNEEVTNTTTPLQEYPAYVIVLKFGDIAVLSPDEQDYDDFGFLCPQGKQKLY